jgi:catechol 2,3-dioxygenase-like lactoylglutathione lyase family enzyme
MLDHIGIKVADLAKSKAFYSKALEPIGYGVIMELGPELGLGYVGVGFGKDGKPDFWLGEGPKSGPLHVAFAVKTRAEVDAFHRAAMSAGAKDNGAPGVREHYHPSYYGAFVFDPDGNNLEVVCHKPQ